MIDLEAYRPQIEAALAYSGGTHLFEDVVQGVIDGRMQAWVNGDTIAITEVVVFPRKKTLHCFLAGGKLRGVIEMMPSAIAWGQVQGCTAFTVAGRKGWMRVLSRHGWEPQFYVMGVPI
jgi:hypothetical protein